MNSPTDQPVAVLVPQVNVNDEEVLLVGWRVGDGESVNQGQPIAEIETSKSVEEIPAPAGGVILQVAQVGQRLRVGALFAYVGSSKETIDAFVATANETVGQADAAGAEPRITAGAAALARRYGFDPAAIPASGGVLRRDDVERFAQESNAPAAGVATIIDETVPPALLEKVGPPTELREHEWAVAQHLSRTRARLVPAHVAMDVAMDRVAAWVEARRTAGTMTGPLPAIVWAVGVALKDHAPLAAFRLGRRVYAYRSLDVAFTARGRDGRLFAPVIREVDRRSPGEVIAECARLTMGLYRGQLKADELGGGCMTVSLLDQQPVLWHVGLQNAYQSAILTVGAVREQVVWAGGQAVARPTATLVLSYDHGLVNGWEASAFLDHIRKLLGGLGAQ